MNRRKGFTLLETLLALTVFVGAFGLVLQALGGAMRMTRISGEISKAVMWAQNKLDAVGIDTPIKVGREAGNFGRDYRFAMDISEFQPQDSEVKPSPGFPIQLYRVELIVSWGEPPFQRQEVFTTLKSRVRDGAFF